MLYIVTYLSVGVVKTIRVIPLGVFEMGSGRVGQGSYKLLETVNKKENEIGTKNVETYSIRDNLPSLFESKALISM
jgi:hypothetical protein